MLSKRIGVVWSRRRTDYDWTLGVRWRGYSQLFEGSAAGSIQVRLGVVTP